MINKNYRRGQHCYLFSLKNIAIFLDFAQLNRDYHWLILGHLTLTKLISILIVIQYNINNSFVFLLVLLFPSTHGNCFPRDLIVTFVHKQLDYLLTVLEIIFLTKTLSI